MLVAGIGLIVLEVSCTTAPSIRKLPNTCVFVHEGNWKALTTTVGSAALERLSGPYRRN